MNTYESQLQEALKLSQDSFKKEQELREEAKKLEQASTMLNYANLSQMTVKDLRNIVKASGLSIRHTLSEDDLLFRAYFRVRKATATKTQVEHWNALKSGTPSNFVAVAYDYPPILHTNDVSYVRGVCVDCCHTMVAKIEKGSGRIAHEKKMCNNLKKRFIEYKYFKPLNYNIWRGPNQTLSKDTINTINNTITKKVSRKRKRDETNALDETIDTRDVKRRRIALVQKEEAKAVESVLKYELSENIPKTMRALIKEKAGSGYVLRTDYQVPTPKEDELLIRSFTVAICGNDSILYNWTKEAKTIAKLPFIPGHEAAGLIVGVGKNCRFRIGERVAIENHFYCGECYQCSINRKDICSNLQQFGHGKGTIYGGCCEYYVCKEKYCYRLKAEGISWRDAALLEPLGVAYNACERADLNEKPPSKQPQPKETVLVIGCGTIGCMAVGVAKTMPVTGKVIALDVSESKLAVAKKMGADVLLNLSKLKGSLKEELLQLTDNVGVGRIIECSGHSPTINEMFGGLRKGGCVTLVGLPKEAIKFENPLQDIIFKSIQIRTIHGRPIFKTWNKTEKLVSDRKIVLDPLVSHVLALEDFEEGYKALQSGTALKVVFKLSENIPKTMRALIKEKAGSGYVLRTDYQVPTPKEDELLIRSFTVAICGSDSIFYNWTKEAKTIAKLPFIPGHEALNQSASTHGMNVEETDDDESTGDFNTDSDLMHLF